MQTMPQRPSASSSSRTANRFADQHDIAFRQAAPCLQHHLPGPVGRSPVPPAMHPAGALGRDKGRQKRQRPDPSRPRDRHRQLCHGAFRRRQDGTQQQDFGMSPAALEK